MDREKNMKIHNCIFMVCAIILLFFSCVANFVVYAQAADGTEIVFTGVDEIAYTNEDKTEAYIYYDVIGKYGNSVRESVNISWSVSDSVIVDVDTSSGRITIKKNKDSEETYTYGTKVYVVGVDVKSGKSVNGTFVIGMVQAIDEVEMVGFVNSRSNRKKIEVSLPSDFAKDTWHLLYITKDQNGNVCDTEKYDPEKLTFIVDNPMLVDSVSSAGDLYTIDGIKYASVVVNPGSDAKQGGKAGFTVISNKTGTKTTKTFNINIYIPFELKKEQNIQAKSVTKVYGCKNFYLNAVTSGNGMLEYSSVNQEVAYVDSNGKVYITGYGETSIIINAQETNEYKSASKRITITVIPEAVSIKKAFSPSRGKIQYEWKKQKNISGYEVYIDKNKSFKMKQSTSVKKNKGLLTIDNIVSGKIYYMKIRSYKNIDKNVYYGKWSKVSNRITA